MLFGVAPLTAPRHGKLDPTLRALGRDGYDWVTFALGVLHRQAPVPRLEPLGECCTRVVAAHGGVVVLEMRDAVGEMMASLASPTGDDARIRAVAEGAQQFLVVAQATNLV